MAMAASVNGIVPPLSYDEASLSADAEKRQAAMQNEYKSLVESKTWDLVIFYFLENERQMGFWCKA